MKVDFFVHPEHTRNWDDYREVYPTYLSHLERIHEESQFPVLVKGLEDNDFSKRFPKENVLQSNSYHFFEHLSSNSGDVRSHEFSRLKKIADNGEEFRIHGSFFGQCTKGFAIQLFAYIHRNEDWHRDVFSENNEISRREKMFFRFHEFRGDFKNSGIKYGVVLHPPKKIKVRKPPKIIKNLLLYRNGNFNHQLIDGETVIYKK